MFYPTVKAIPSSQERKRSLRIAILFGLVVVAWISLMIASLQYRFLDYFAVGLYHEQIGYDFFQSPRGFNNLLLGNNIYFFSINDYGPYSTPYLYHPFVAVAVGPWTSPFSPWTAYYIFVDVSIVLLGISAWLLSSAFDSPAMRGFAWFAVFCSIPTYAMIWNGQSHVFLILAVSLILAGLMRLAEDDGHDARYLRWIQLGLLIALLSKPVVILMLPVLFVLPETRRKLLMPIAIYAAISLAFLLIDRLNPGGYNALHWTNIARLSSSPVQILGLIFPNEYNLLRDYNIYSLPVLLDRVFQEPTPGWFLKFPLVVILAMSLSPLLYHQRRQRITIAIMTVSACIFSFCVYSYCVQEYYYTMTQPGLLALLWLFRREDTRWLRYTLLGAFIVSLAIFLPTPYFLSPNMLMEHWISSTLMRALPSAIVFLCLIVCWATLTRRELFDNLNADKDIIAADAVRPLKRTVFLGGAMGLMFVAVLVAVFATCPKRMLKLPKEWTLQEHRDHLASVLDCRGMSPAIRDEVNRVLAVMNHPGIDAGTQDKKMTKNAAMPK